MKALAIFVSATALPSVLAAARGRSRKAKPKSKSKEISATEAWNAHDWNPDIFNPYVVQGQVDPKSLSHRELKELCSSGKVHGGAEYLMSDYVTNGKHGFEWNKAHGYQWLQKSAKRKHPPALNEMGTFYLTGDHFKVQKDVDKAVDLFTDAAMRDHGLANLNLANIYRDASSGKFNRDKALLHLEKAAKLRIFQAYVLLVEIYESGSIGNAVDLDKSSYWLKKCYQDTKNLATKNSECTLMLAERYLRGINQFPKRWEPGLQIMREAQQQGQESAARFFELLEQGLISEKNYGFNSSSSRLEL